MKNVVASTSLSYKGNFQLVSIFCLASICGAAASAEENSLYSEISDDTLYELLLAEFTTGDGETDPQSDRYTDLPVEEQVVEEPLINPYTDLPVEEQVVEEPLINPYTDLPVEEQVVEEPLINPYTDLPVEEQVVEEPLFEFFTEALIEEILVGTI